MSRVLVVLYGVVSYGVFLGVFLYAVGFIGGFGAPTLLDGAQRAPFGHVIMVDFALLGGFAVQHSGMARPAFKRWLTRFMPEAAERPTYVLMTCVALIALFAFWQPFGGMVWDVTDPNARVALYALYGFGWALLLYCTFLIDHFDLFGLKQVWRFFTGKAYQPPQFRTPMLYRLVRHPLYVGWLIIFWATPTMGFAHLFFAVATTAYILIAIQLEERDLKAMHPEYAEYKRTTPMLIPRLTPKPESLRRIA
ncbi:MAG TPA: hypothetical protein VG943_03930 [Caulobacterales bacterium]|nr:hypothetical protein [Caulobacterales bacterium]